MSIDIINIATKRQNYNVSKYCKATTFGLRNNLNIKDLFYKQMLLLALEYDDSFGVLSVADRAIMLSEIAIPIGGKSGCSTC